MAGNIEGGEQLIKTLMLRDGVGRHDQSTDGGREMKKLWQRYSTGMEVFLEQVHESEANRIAGQKLVNGKEELIMRKR